ncbi:MAG: hypothetical protein COT71_01125 [Candidatus Andersenbacteria bacterium CG10_big_fil_rev_8_21_14_0_10_54_11]|uniref:AI-2E family transporter n=1 Tax=Candidatus Andersenbacteria bacterium CG10_big_fil_rev_8_21_14_0_10_54_11 TaxID=1974485 RepID=A0A2M6X002_9BACT|nr:MAG: hypothetical protein COT71_01125 [Candidatus Andersenbacteria bacterium CG10_big_fil_rev_8_21_14_0_10_54_11]
MRLPAQRIDISTGTFVRAAAVLAAVWLLWQLSDLVLLLYGAFLVAAIAEPVAKNAERYRVPRAVSVIIFYILILAAVAGIVGLIVDPVARQVEQFAHVLPSLVQRASAVLPLVPDIDQQTAVRSLQEGLLRFGDNFAQVGSNIFAGTRSVVGGVVSFVFVFVIALYLVIERDVLPKLVRVLSPAAYEEMLLAALREAQRSVGRWILGQAVLGLIVGMLVGLGLQFLGVPYALLLGILAGIMELLPAIGPFLAAVPGVLLAFTTQSWLVGTLTLFLYAVVGQVESHVLIPNIMRRAVGLRPLVTIIAVLTGARLLGTLGIILAIPTAAIISIFLRHILRTGGADETLAG